MPYEGEKAVIKTNLKASLGFVFSYKFLSVRLGVRPGLSDNEIENKGETDFFRIRLKLLFDNWTHRFEYNYTRGFYIDNTDDFGLYDSDFHIQLPNLTTNIISGSSHYNFNKNYSVKAVESNTEIQLKSSIYWPINRRSTIKTSIYSSGIFSNSSILENEKYRIGGTQLLRGFNEDQFLSGLYTVGSLEYRFLISQNGFLSAFSDMAFIQFKNSSHLFLKLYHFT